VPAVPSAIIETIWNQGAALLPSRHVFHSLGCHRPRVPDRVVFDKLVQVLVFGCAYHRIADATCSATTLRRRRDEWIAAGVMERLHKLVLTAYDRLIGLALDDIAVDCCITKAPCGGELAGRSPVGRGKLGLKRSLAVDAAVIPLGIVVAPANHHDVRLRVPTLDALAVTGAPMTLHLDRGYDSDRIHALLTERGVEAAIARKGFPAPVTAGQRWVVERTTAWTNAHKKLVWCTERRAAVIAFWMKLSAVLITVSRLVRAAWIRYRWDRRPAHRP
jgi:transposase